MPDPAPTGQPKPFTQFLSEQRRGDLHADLTDQLAELVRQVTTHRKQGKLTLSITIKPTGDHHVEVLDDVTVKTPRGERPAGIFFTDDQGGLHRNDPRQPSLLRPVDGERREEATQ